MNQSEKITVVIVDDSSVIRRAISKILESDPSIEILASVANGEIAISSAKTKKPDIILLDIEMPVMDGLTALPEILKNSPDTKVIICSSLTEHGAETTMKAMELGAVECMVKPKSAQDTGPDSPFHTMLLEIVRSLGTKKAESGPDTSNTRTAQADIAPTTKPTVSSQHKPVKSYTLADDSMAYKGKPKILAIGSSTGGPKALFEILKDIGNLDIPIVITQHMPATFTKILAEHITQKTGLEAYEGAEGMTAEAGKVYVAPGGIHMTFEQDGANLNIKLDDGPPENFCKPAVDPMMRSLINIYGGKILCVILTGMGSDGLKSAQSLVASGGRLIAQNEETSVVWGMPGVVAAAGLCSAVLPLSEIGPWVKKACA